MAASFCQFNVPDFMPVRHLNGQKEAAIVRSVTKNQESKERNTSHADIGLTRIKIKLFARGKVGWAP